jgi:hypothetical protein
MPWATGAIVVTTALLIVSLILREKRRLDAKDRFDRQQCVNCGYDLRASEDRCPECGFPIQAPELPLTMALDRQTLANDWPPETQNPRQPGSDEIRVEVYASEEMMAVDLLAEQLEARGLITSVSSSKTKFVDPISVTTVERTYKKLAVWSGDLDQAVKIIHSFSSASIARRSSTSV